MATIKEKYGDRSLPTKELRVEITRSDGTSYAFVLFRKHIEVVQTTPTPNQKGGQARNTDWYTTLTDEEKAQVFAIIMHRYRERSFGDNGFKGAAIGVVPDVMHGADPANNGQSRLFIGTNTMRWASPYFKDCAEQNMVNNATDTLAYESTSKGKPPQLARFKAIYIMQGVSDERVPMACACGKCTDMLASGVMTGGLAPVYTIPLLTPELRKRLMKDTGALSIDEKSENIGQVPSPLDSLKAAEKRGEANPQPHCTVWKKPIIDLNAHRVIALKDMRADLQDHALDDIIKHAMGDYGLPERRGKRYENVLTAWIKRQHPNEELPTTPLGKMELLLGHIRAGLKNFTKKMRELLPFFATPAEKAVENILLQRKSEANLDATVDEHNNVDIHRMNQFLVGQIADTLADRLMAPRETKDKNGKPIKQIAQMTPSQKKEWVRENMKSIRCVAIQLDDGTFHYAVQVDGAIDNAMPNAEVVALENAVGSLGRHGVRHVWVMEMNPKDIENHVMRTSPKEGVERLCKRGSSKGIDFTFIPFNFNGKTFAEVESHIANKRDDELYPGGHKGYLAAAEKQQKQASHVERAKAATGKHARA